MSKKLPAYSLLSLLMVIILLSGCGGSEGGVKVSKPLITLGLIAYYPFDGNANINSGIGKNGTVSGAVAWGTDRFGAGNSVLQLNGTDTAVTVPQAPFIGNAITIAFWVKTTISDTTYFTIWGWQNGFLGIFSKDGTLGMAIANPTTNSAITTSAVQNEIWAHFTATYDGTTIKAYFNGTLEGTKNWSATLDLNNQDLVIGYLYLNQTYWGGSLDDYYIFNRVLSEGEIAQLANQN